MNNPWSKRKKWRCNQNEPNKEAQAIFPEKLKRDACVMVEIAER